MDDNLLKSRDRWAALALAVILTIAFPIALDQGYFRYSSYVLPLLGAFAVLLYLAFGVSHPGVISFARKHVYLSSLVAVLIACTLVFGWHVAIRKSKEHIAEIQRKENPPPARSANSGSLTEDIGARKKETTIAEKGINKSEGKPKLGPQNLTKKPAPVSNQTEVALEFAGREQLMVQLANTTSITAERPKYWFGMEDVTNCFAYPAKPEECQPLALPTQTYHDDYINGENRLGPWDVLNLSQDVKQHVKTGDVLIGMIAVTCFNCSRERVYYVYFKMGEGGWFCRVSDPNRVQILKPMKAVPDEILDGFLQHQAPAKDCIQIPEQFDYTRPTTLLP